MKKTLPSNLRYVLALFVCLISAGLFAQVSIATLPYSKSDNFNTYNPTNAATSTSTASSWTNSNPSNSYLGQSTGTGTGGGIYSFGTAGDFSLGALPSSSFTPSYSISFTNNSGSTITSITLSWDYEQWRYANVSGWDVTGTGQLLTNTTLNAKDFTGTATGTSGTGSTTSISSFTLTGLNITSGQSFGMNFIATNLAGSDNGVSIDNFSMTASAAPVAAPEINITNGLISIASGDITPSLSDDTDFGDVNVTSGTNPQTFTIQNTGDAPLTVGAITISGTNASDFTVTATPTSPVAITNGTTTFDITFNPSGVGARTATFSMVNNDSNENPYTFALAGNGLADTNAPDYTELVTDVASVTQGSTTPIIAKIYEGGLTEAAGPGANISGWIGYSATNTNPNTGSWTWIAATYSGQVVNDEEFTASLGAGLVAGTYYYASRFQITNGPYTYGGTNSVWNSNSGILTVNPDVVDYAAISSAPSVTINEGGSTTILTQVFEPGLTESAGAGSGFTREIGYSTSNTNPNGGAGWVWTTATFSNQVGNNDEYSLTIGSTLPVGVYYYASRFKKTGSTVYVYGGTSGNSWNSNSGVLTVALNVVDFANIQSPASGSIAVGGTFNVYAQVYEPGVTEAAGAGAGISGWIGYSSTNTNPNTASWTWVAATFNTQAGNNDEYTANIGTTLAAGNYFYASRFQRTGSSSYIYGGLNGIWNNDSGTLAVTAPEINVQGNGVNIVDNTTITSSGDHTDFGSVQVTGEFVTRTFTIQNTGTSVLTLGTNAVSLSSTSTGFSIAQQPATTVAAAGFTTFQVTFDPSVSGAAIITVNIANNDSNENPYNFNVVGTGALPDFISISAFNTAVTENFNSMLTSATAATPLGFGIQTGTNATVTNATTQQASTGTPNTGGAYNFGQNGTTDRALGFIFSGSYSNQSIALKVKNTTGSNISTFGIVFDYEQYRRFSATQTFKLQYSTSMTSGWTDVAGGGFTNMVANAIELHNFTTLIAFQAINISYTPAVPVANGASVYFRWILSGTTSSQGVGIDNFSIQACATPTFTMSPSQTICSGTAPANMTISGATGTIQWQSSTDNVNFTNIVGQTTATLSGAAVGNLTSSRYFRAVVTTAGCGAFNSDAISISIDPAAVGGTVAGGATVCSATNSGTLTLSGNTGGVIGWESSTDNFSTAGTPIANTTSSLTYSNLSVTTSFRAHVQSGNCYAYSSVATISVGNSSTTWDANGWSNGDPAIDKAVIFAADFQTSEDLSACSVTVMSGANVIVSNQNDMTVNGAVNVETGATLVFQNNANLLQLTNAQNSGDVSVFRASSFIKRLDYTLWSSPVIGQNLLDFSPNTILTRFYIYNTNTNLYNSVTPSTTDFETGKGYLIRMPDDSSADPSNWYGEFKGAPHNGPVVVTMANGGVGSRFNAVGNPYPSPINMNQFVSDNSSNITGTLYFWRKTNSSANPSYSTWTGTGFTSNGQDEVYDPFGVLQTGQGFIVEALGDATTLNFNNGQRIGDNSGQFFRSAQTVEKHRVWLNATSDAGAFSQMLVGYVSDATSGVDNGLDGKYLNDGPIALNSVIEGNDYVIQAKALPFDASDIVPLSFKATTAGNYTIAIDHVDGLFAGEESQIVYLKDNNDGTIHDLSVAGYNFASEAGTFASRFELVYQLPLAVENPIFNTNNVVLYSHDGSLLINSGNTIMDNVKVYDIRGRLLAEKSGINASEVSINAGNSTEVLIVKITSDTNVTVTKKAIR